MSESDAQRHSNGTDQPSSVLLDMLTRYGDREDRITHVQRMPARPARHAEWPEWLHPEVRGVYESFGIAAPWEHQVRAADLAHGGTDTVLATGTASGKSLGFLMPILDAIVRTRDEVPTRQATALYISPTKALAHDQLAKVRDLPLKGLRPVGYDGDASRADKDWGRIHANLIFTNPDMLHLAVLPAHPRFSRWFKALRYVVVDEAHRYRGMFGSHIALIVRRLLRVAAHYGAEPVVVGASATMAAPDEAFARFTGRPAAAVTDDASPRAAGRFVLWEPPLMPGEDAGEDPDDVFAALGVDMGAAAEPDPWADSDARPGPGTDRGAGRSSAGSAGAGFDPMLANPFTDDAAARRSTISEAADILTDATCSGFKSIGFIGSRRGAEVLADAVRVAVKQVDTPLSKTVAAYRGGYLPEERRVLEKALRTGALHTVASTNALELGIDISGLDLVVMCGWPGTLASLWQQAGRAGRGGAEWLAVLIARDDPLDTYVVHHPRVVFDAPVEAGVIDPENPFVLGGHLCAAAQEIPLTAADLALFGPKAGEVVAGLTAGRMLRERPTGWYWAKAESAAALTDIRGSGEAQVRIVEAATGSLLGTVDDAGAHMQIHTGAVYLHQGLGYVVTALDLAERVAMVEQRTVDYSTQARSLTEIAIESVDESHSLPSGATVHHGTVEVTDQVTSYLMKQKGSGVVLGEFELDLPARTLRTHAVWWTAPAGLLDQAGVAKADLPGAVHAAEHAAIGLLPLFAGCDRWDIGGVSTALHADTGKATVFVYDGQPGGAGFAERGFNEFTRWEEATLAAVSACECATGCPSCVQSPKCGNGNEPLDKDAAIRLLAALLG